MVPLGYSYVTEQVFESLQGSHLNLKFSVSLPISHPINLLCLFAFRFTGPCLFDDIY